MNHSISQPHSTLTNIDDKKDDTSISTHDDDNNNIHPSDQWWWSKEQPIIDEQQDNHVRHIVSLMIQTKMVFMYSHSTSQHIYYISNSWKEKWWGPKYRIIVSLQKYKVPVAILHTTWNILTSMDSSLNIFLVSIPIFGSYTVYSLSVHKR